MLAVFRPWTTLRTWRHLVYLVLDLVVGFVTFTVVLTLLAVTVGLLIPFPLALPFAWLLFVCAAGFGMMERSRAAALLDTSIASPHAPLPEASWFRRLWARTTSASRWREIAYALLKLPVGAIAFSVAVVVWCGSAALAALPLYVNALPGDSAEFGLFDVSNGTGAIIACIAGVLGLVFLAPWTTVALAHVEAALSRALLGPSRVRYLEAEMTRPPSTPVAVVDNGSTPAQVASIATESAPITQEVPQLSDAARTLVAGEHEDTKAVMAELRELVRGLHPAPLGDGGLEAALSALAARSAVPVEVAIDVGERPPAAIEDAAYDVVVEALDNVARHSAATRASVSIARRGDRLVIDVTDDGHGGADAARGSGLQELADRVRGLGGWMQVLSPPGGPTGVLVELPCAS